MYNYIQNTEKDLYFKKYHILQPRQQKTPFLSDPWDFYIYLPTFILKKVNHSRIGKFYNPPMDPMGMSKPLLLLMLQQSTSW